MANCKKEFIEHTKEKDILCASIEYGKAYWDEDAKKHSVLKVGFTETDFNLFLKSLNYFSIQAFTFFSKSASGITPDSKTI